MTNRKKILDRAKREKNNDEFYTQLSDIEMELRHYRPYFKNKVIYCNCDDPLYSNFFVYFVRNFTFLGLKKLITTHYSKSGHSYKIVVTKKNIDQVMILDEINIDKNAKIPLKGNGDFRSPECIDLLKKSDIVVSNPPFSLFRDYVKQLVDYHKDFIIIGNKNALSYSMTFYLFRDDIMRTGYRNVNKDMWFILPKTAKKYEKIVDGHKEKHIMGCWFTSLPVKKHQKFMTLFHHYDPKKYPTYVNYPAINVDRVSDIPMDYNGRIGVPITFFDKYNPKQFKILALGKSPTINFTSNRKMKILKKSTGKWNGKYTYNAKATLYYKYDPKTMPHKNPAFEDCENGDKYISPYARVIIQKRSANNAD